MGLKPLPGDVAHPIGLALDCAREAADISARELARRLEMSPGALGPYLRGEESPRYELIVMVAGACGVTVEWIQEQARALDDRQQGERLLRASRRA